MRVAAVLLALGILALPGCSPGGDDNCCAISPRAKCQAALLKQGITREEADIVMGPAENICTSDSLSADRLRHIASVWGPGCVGEAQNILVALNRDDCSPPALRTQAPRHWAFLLTPPRRPRALRA